MSIVYEAVPGNNSLGGFDLSNFGHGDSGEPERCGLGVRLVICWVVAGRDSMIWYHWRRCEGEVTRSRAGALTLPLAPVLRS